MSSSAKHQPVGVELSQHTLASNVYAKFTLDREWFEAICSTFGKEAWNCFCRRIRGKKLDSLFSIPETQCDDDCCSAVQVEIRLTGEDFSAKNLEGYDFRLPICESTNFTKAQLAGAVFGDVEYAVFRSADLRGADFTEAYISGADFSDANIEGALFEGSIYVEGLTPLGLDDSELSKCQVFPAYYKENPSVPDKGIPLSVSGSLESFWGWGQ